MDLRLRTLERQWEASGDLADLRQLNLARKRLGIDATSHTNLPNLDDWGGYMAHHVTDDGRLIVMVTSNGADIDQEAGAYALICDEHGGLFYRDSIQELIPEQNFPDDWCHECWTAKERPFLAFANRDKVQNLTNGRIGRVTWAGMSDYINVRWDDDGSEELQIDIRALRNLSKRLLD